MARRTTYLPMNPNKYDGSYPITLKSSWESNFARVYCDMNPACISWCFDDQTEILTEHGWKFLSALDHNEKLATLNPKTHYLEYHITTQIQHLDYNGEMISIQNRLLNLVVTPDHNMYVKFCKDVKHSKKTEYWELIKAQHLTENHRIKRNCKWSGEELDFYEFGEYRVPMDTWLEFLGYYIAEGCSGSYTKGYTDAGKKRTDLSHVIQISQHKLDTKAIMEFCLEKLPFDTHYYGGCFRISSKVLVDLLSPLGKSSEKYIPYYVKQLSSRQLKIILDALLLGDGSFGSSGNERIYYTSSKILADDVQEIALKCGYAASIKPNDSRGREVYIEGRGITGYTNHINYKVSIQRKQLESYIGKENIETIQYTGKVHCVTVPNHIVYVRRNGKCAWCGQCYEPWRIPYRDPVTGRQTIYIPDFLMSFQSPGGQIKTALIEIKPLHEALREHARNVKDAMQVDRNLAKWEAAIGWCQRRGNVEFVVLTEAEMFAGGENIKPPKRRRCAPTKRRIKKI